MIILKKLSWSNAFSYGQNNSVDLDKFQLVQLLGKNGNGKSSIALILEEVLFNKNSKGIKKTDILNRYVKDKKYSIELTFEKDSVQYKIISTRGTTQTVELYRDNENISEHTATNTYKLIENILGIDHKTFSQIVYQSNSSNLEFLTATDTNRKKFLIDLLNLSIYNKGLDLFKSLLKTQNNEAEVVELKIKTITDWLAKLGTEDLIVKDVIEVPQRRTDLMEELAELKLKLKNIEALNKKITQNNTYKDILKSIDITPIDKPVKDIKPLEIQSTKLLHTLTELDSTIRGTGVLKDKCSVCGQPIDNTHKKLIKQEAENKKQIVTTEFNEINKELIALGKEYHKYDAYIKHMSEWERYHSLVDNTIPEKVFDRDQIIKAISNIEKELTESNVAIEKVMKLNEKIAAHNAKVKVLSEQMVNMREDLTKLTTINSELQNKLTTLQLLVKTFSTTGLVAYKIECLVKDLERLTNEYLLDMSDGRFQLLFKVNSSDKLNVIIVDNGIDIDIAALSNGERSRVNVSTLLAIRKLMQSLSKSKINLLILDETVESLDQDGKEKLIEVLLKEDYLNTMLISHGFSHPLLEKISVVKENNISRIE